GRHCFRVGAAFAASVFAFSLASALAFFSAGVSLRFPGRSAQPTASEANTIVTITDERKAPDMSETLAKRARMRSRERGVRSCDGAADFARVQPAERPTALMIAARIARASA